VVTPELAHLRHAAICEFTSALAVLAHCEISRQARYAATLDEAKADFARNWDALKAWKPR
jgi:hypothetical protein